MLFRSDAYRPALGDLLYRSGNLYTLLGDTAKAETSYLESVGVYSSLLGDFSELYAPKMSEVLNQLGMLYLSGKRYSSALIVFEKEKEMYQLPGASQHPDTQQSLAYCYNNIATAQLGLRKLDSAWEAMTRSMQLDNQNSWLYRNLACYYALKKDPEKAIQNLSQAADLGYDDYRWLTQENSLDSVRNHPRFGAIAAKIAKNSGE